MDDSLYEEDQSPERQYSFLKEYFRKDTPQNYYLVDVGPGHGFSNSFSYNFLEDHSWKGLLIEPSRKYVESLRKLYERSPNALVINLGVSYTGETQLFYQVHDSFSFKKRSVDKFIQVDTLPLEDILERAHTPVSFDLLILNTLDSDSLIFENFLKQFKYRPRVVLSRQKCKDNAEYSELHSTSTTTIYLYKGVADGTLA